MGFLYGALSSVLCGLVTAVVCGIGNSKIIASAKFTLNDSHYTTKRVANIISFFTTGFTILIIALMIII